MSGAVLTEEVVVLKRITSFVGIVAFAIVMLVPSQALALTQRTGDNVTVDEAIADDLYVFGNNIDVVGTVDGDVIAFGQSVRISGDVKGDVIAAGQYVIVSGAVGGSVRAAGQDVRLESDVSEDFVAAGQNVRISGDGSVGRDAVMGGASVLVAGDVGRNVLAGSQDLRIEASVGGDVTADVDNLTIASEGSVEGDVNYYSDEEATIDGDIAGEINKHAPRTSQVEYRRPSPMARAFWGVIGWVRNLIGMAIFALLALLAARPVVERASWEAWYGRPLVAGLIGLGIVVGSVPVAFMVFFIGLLLGGWWIAFVWMAVIWLLALLGVVVISLAVGIWLVATLARRAVHPMVAVLLGIVVFSVVGAIPFLGWLAAFIGTLMGMGGIVLALYATKSAPSAPSVSTTPAVQAPMTPPAPPA